MDDSAKILCGRAIALVGNVTMIGNTISNGSNGCNGGTDYGSGGYSGDEGISVPPVVTPVPEPETYAMLLAGLGLIGFMVRRRKEDFNFVS
jgi:hypothetical protein